MRIKGHLLSQFQNGNLALGLLTCSRIISLLFLRQYHIDTKKFLNLHLPWPFEMGDTHPKEREGCGNLPNTSPELFMHNAKAYSPSAFR